MKTKEIFPPLFALWITACIAFFPFICFSQEQSWEEIEALVMNAKFIAPEAILKDFGDGKSKTRVIVELLNRSAFNRNQDMNNMEVRQELEDGISKAQNRVINNLNRRQVHVTNRFKYIFGFSAEVTLEGLKDLINNPDVLFIEKDEILHTNLAQGIPLMNAATARNSYNGSGLSIAICDTGIDYTHTRLGGGSFPNSKVIGGYDCGDDNNDPMDQNGHGTACAGIAAGDLGSDGDYIGGVAHGARLYAVKISFGSGGSAYTSDMIEGWEWCITHQNDDPNNPIMVISTSFGGVRHHSPCDSYSTLMTTAAANAVSAGMTLFVSSGNDGDCDSIEWPACISHVISVGAVYDADFTASSIGWCVSPESCATKHETSGCSTGWYSSEVPHSDSVIVYSNTASFLSLLAPSNWATTTKMGGGYWTSAYGFGGTSAACPYAAGAAACLQNANKTLAGSFLTPAQVKAKFVDTGDAITDGKIGITKPRINLGAAVDTLVSKMKITPSGNLSSKGNSGGPFSPAGIVYTLENQTDTGINYSVSKGASWVSISDTGGSLAGHASTDVTVSINSNANSLSNGTYTDTINFINTTDHNGDTTRDVILTVGAPTLQYSWNMDSNPGWTTEGLWAWGQPTGGGGQYGSPDPTSGYTGSNVYGYNLSGDYENNLPENHLTTDTIDCTGMSQVTVKLRRWLGVESPSYDHAYVRVSNDGNSWITVWENQSSVTDSSWSLQEFNISSVADGRPTMYLRWTMGATDSSWQYCGWNIDDVEIWAVQTTAASPTVTTTAVSSVTSTSASSGGNVTSEGSASVTARGVCWSRSANPATDSDNTADGTGVGSFPSSITGLTPGTTYHVRAYATNSAGTAYGSDISFETSFSNVLYVGNNKNCGTKAPCYGTIQNAINAAGTGSVILVKQGTFAESLSLGSPKTLLIKGGYNSTYNQQTANTTFIEAPGPTDINVSSGSLKFQVINVK